MKFTKIANYASRPEAEMMKTLLEKQGIPVVLQSNAPGIFGTAAVASAEGISLLVPEKDAEKAKETITSMQGD